MPEESAAPDLAELVRRPSVVRLTSYADIDKARAAAERLARDRG